MGRGRPGTGNLRPHNSACHRSTQLEFGRLLLYSVCSWMQIIEWSKLPFFLLGEFSMVILDLEAAMVCPLERKNLLCLPRLFSSVFISSTGSEC